MNKQLQRGFTIIELMMALLVLALLISVAVPSFGSFINNNRITSQANNFHAAILYARSEAVKRNRDVFMCWSGNPAAASPCGSSGTGWADGWVMFADEDEDGAYDANELIRSHDGITGGASLTETGGGGLASFSYSSDGRISSSAASFKFCDANNNDQYTRELSFSPLGNPRVTKSGTCP